MISAVDAVLGAAALLTFVREEDGPNKDAAVIAMQRTTGNAPPDPWCASFIYYVGSGVLGKRWPLPSTASCDVLLAFARKRGWLVTTPARGDLFLVLRADHDATHVGFVTGIDGGGRFRTCEGNTNPDGGRDGDGVYTRLRGAAHDRVRYAFIRWPIALEDRPPPAA